METSCKSWRMRQGMHQWPHPLLDASEPEKMCMLCYWLFFLLFLMRWVKASYIHSFPFLGWMNLFPSLFQAWRQKMSIVSQMVPLFYLYHHLNNGSKHCKHWEHFTSYGEVTMKRTCGVCFISNFAVLAIYGLRWRRINQTNCSANSTLNAK